jgi:hypothetical protein
MPDNTLRQYLQRAFARLPLAREAREVNNHQRTIPTPPALGFNKEAQRLLR